MHAIIREHILGFLNGIACDGRGRFGDVFVTAHFVEANNVEEAVQERRNFRDFIRVPGRKDQFGKGHGAKVG